MKEYTVLFAGSPPQDSVGPLGLRGHALAQISVFDGTCTRTAKVVPAFDYQGARNGAPIRLTPVGPDLVPIMPHSTPTTTDWNECLGGGGGNGGPRASSSPGTAVKFVKSPKSGNVKAADSSAAAG